MAALRAYSHGDRRILFYNQYSEGNYPFAPGTESAGLSMMETWQDGYAREVKLPRDESQPVTASDSDYPLTACGERKVRWIEAYNAQICRIASNRGLKRCGIRYKDELAN